LLKTWQFIANRFLDEVAFQVFKAPLVKKLDFFSRAPTYNASSHLLLPER
jgi:hypothetical protein